MKDDHTTEKYSSSFWINKLYNLAAVLLSVWIITWLANEESEPDAAISKIVLYPVGFIIAAMAAWNALNFIFNWRSDEPLPPIPKGPDDLTRIEGIGPKIAALLQDAGYNSYKALSQASVKDLKTVLAQGGDQFKSHDPSTWTRQARLAANAEWDELDDLQAKLTGGKD